jgi:branched-chain amino acid transport system substrate-binding protein
LSPGHRIEKGPRRTAAAILVCVAAVATLAGCFSSGSGIQTGERLDVYVSMPLHGPEAQNGRDIVDAARLALADAHGMAGPLRIRAIYLDDTSGHGASARWSPAAAAANARRASQDSAAIAYIGDFDSGATRFSLPITNEAHILQVSPASSAVDLVQPFLGAGDQIPEEVQPTGQRTFGRVIPSDEAQANAGARWAKRLNFPAVNLFSDGSLFGRTMEAAFGDEARAIGLKPRRTPLGNPPPKLDCAPARGHAQSHAYYAGASIPTHAQVECALAPARVSRLITTDAMLNSAAIRAFGSRPDLMITSATEDPKQLPPAGQRFLRAFQQRYHRMPGRYAPYGYEAMAVVLDSIRRAGDSGDDRDSVVNEFFDTTDRHSILGAYSVDEVGNTTLNRLAGYRVSHGRPVFTTALSAPP